MTRLFFSNFSRFIGIAVVFALRGTDIAGAAPGSLDPTFGANGKVITPIGSGNDSGYSMAVQGDGKIVVAGYAMDGSYADFAMARFNPDGTLDSGFGTGGKVITPISGDDDRAYGVTLQDDGKIVLAGTTGSDMALVRYNPDGTPDLGFGVAGTVITSIGDSNGANGVVVQGDGKIVVAGNSHIGGSYDAMVARFNSDGSLDSGFGTNGAVTTPIGSGEGGIKSVALQSDGKIVVGGYAKMGSTYDFAVLRFTASGALDSSFGVGGKVTTSLGDYNDTGYGVALQPDGKIVLAGESAGGLWTHLAVARYTSSGELDGSFGTGGKATTNFSSSDYGRSVAVRRDGKIFVAGKGENSQSGGGFALACFKSNGVLDGSFGVSGMSITKIGTSSSSTGYAMALQGDGKIVVAGLSWIDSNFDIALLRYDGGEVATVPEIGVSGSVGDIVDGDTTPSKRDDTDLGNSPPSGEMVTRTFTITNHGTAPLVLSGTAPNFVTLSGSNAFSVTQQPASDTVEPGGGTATFTIAFQPGSVGETQTAVSIASNDSDENPFNFVISATGMLPEIALSGNGTNIVRGDTLPSTADHTDFGTILASEGRVKRSFTISNYGGSALQLGGTAPNYVTLSGSTAFQVTRQPALGIVEAGGGTTTFEITYDADTVGIQTATVSIPNNDLDESPFTFSIQGTGKLPLPGDLDISFNGTGIVNSRIGNGDDGALSVAVQGDGRILAAGFSFNGNNADFALARYNPDGSPDSGFGASGQVITSIGNGDDLAYGVALQSDGKIVVAGYAYNATNRDIAVVRYNTDGTLDSGFGTGGKVITPIGGGDDVAYDVKVQADGKIVAVGYSYNGANDDMAFVRYNPDGSLDSSFGAGGKLITDFGGTNDYAESVAFQNDGKLAVAGSSYNGSYWSIAVARFWSWGSLDSTFSGDGKETMGKAGFLGFGFSVALQGDGKIVVAGEFGSDFTVLRYNTNGTLDSGFGSGGQVTTYVGINHGAKGVVLQPDGKIVVAGDYFVARYTSNGVLDTNFGSSGIVTTDFGPGKDFTECVALQSDGRIVVAGATHNGTDYDFAVARYADSGMSLIYLTGGGYRIGCGDITPRPEDKTDFGGVDFTGGNVARSFSITNRGTIALNLTGTPRVTISGSSAFSVTTQPNTSSIAYRVITNFQITYDPTVAGNDQAMVSISNNDNTANPFTFAIAGRGLTPLESWRQQWFGTTEDSGNAASMADSDSDGVANLIEWACNLDPTVASKVPGSLEHKDSMLEFTYTRRVAAINSGVNFTVQWSDVLQSPSSWHNSGVTHEVISDNGIVQVVKASVPAESPQRFVRLQVTAPP